MKKTMLLASLLLWNVISFASAFQLQETGTNAYDDESWMFRNRNYTRKLCDLLESGNTIVLAVIPEEVTCANSVISDPQTREIFLKNAENDVLNMAIERFMSDPFFSEHPQFAVVDRKTVTHILDELKFQQTGYVTKEMREELGQMLGVTHLLMISIERAIESSKPNGYFFTDQITVKLVELKLGKILSLESCFSHSINGRFTKRTKFNNYSTDIKDYKFVESE